MIDLPFELEVKQLRLENMTLKGDVGTLSSMLVEVIKYPPSEMRKSGIKSYLYQLGQRDAADAIKVHQ